MLMIMSLLDHCGIYGATGESKGVLIPWALLCSGV